MSEVSWHEWMIPSTAADSNHEHLWTAWRDGIFTCIDPGCGVCLVLEREGSDE